jgi:hypothetical protein
VSDVAAKNSTPADPTAVVKSLDADAIAARLTELDREAAALRVLFKAAKAKARQKQTGRRPDRGAA